MIPQISKALSSGFTSRQIVNYLLRKFPQHANKINNALAAGFTADQVVKYLGGGKKEANKADFEELEDEGMTPFSKTLNKDIKGQESRAKNAFYTGLGAVGAAGGAMALSRSLPQNLLRLGQKTPQVQQTIQQTLQPPMGPGPNSPGVQVMNPSPISPSPQFPQQPVSPLTPSPLSQGLQKSSQPPINPLNNQSPTIPQPQQSLQPIQPQRDIKKSVDIIKSTGHEDSIKNMLSNGMPPKDISTALEFMVGKKKIKELNAATGGIEQAIEDYASSVQQQQPEAPQDLSQELTNPEMPMEQMAPNGMLESKVTTTAPTQEMQDVQVEEKPKPIAKMETVSTPQGIGEVKEIRNGKAIVEVDGKLHKVDESELIQSPISSNDLADLHDDLIRGIEHHTGQEISRNVEWAGYDPKLNELAYKPWQGGGKIYTYTDISPEDVSELQSILAKRKTSGSNLIGAWEKDTDSPIGNRMHALITRLQKERGGKGNEYRTKFETIYDPTEPAKKASQERYKNERKAQNAGQHVTRPSKAVASSKQHEHKEAEKEVGKIDQKELKKEDKIIENLGADGKKVYSSEVATSQIAARPDVMQFKSISESETGENANDLLKGKFDSLKSGVLLLWEPESPSKYDLKGNEKYIVSNGHHRLAFAKREKVPSMLTRIIKEKDGYTARDAMRLGAEINIAEGRGTVYDQAKYFRELIGALGKNEAHMAGSSTGRPGEKAWTIAANAGDELFKSFINEDIKPDQAEAIALSTDNKDRQALGLKFARDGKSPDQIKNLLEASKMIKKKPDEQLSLFGYDDSAFKSIEDMGNAATKLQKNIRESLNAISGASRNPHKAKEFGIDVKDPDAVKSARNKLNKEIERWKNWSSDSDLVKQVKDYVNSH